MQAAWLFTITLYCLFIHGRMNKVKKVNGGGSSGASKTEQQQPQVWGQSHSGVAGRGALTSPLHPLPTDTPGLQASSHIWHLRQEAHQALCEVLESRCPADQGRLARVLLTASTLKSIPPSLLGDLFFRPIIGDVDIAGLLEDMLLLSRPAPVQAEISCSLSRSWKH